MTLTPRANGRERPPWSPGGTASPIGVSGTRGSGSPPHPGGLREGGRGFHAATICLVCALFVALPTPLHAGPVFTCTETTHNFGQLRSDKSVTHEFRVSNTGDADLLIEKVRSTCGGCITATAVGTTITPGEDSVVKATMHGKGLRGTVTRRFYVHSNDPEHKTVAFAFKGTVQPLYTVTPGPAFMLRKVRTGRPAQWEFTLTFPSIPACALTQLEVPGGFTLSAALNTQAASHQLVLRTDGKGLTPGLLRSKVTIHTDSAEAPRVEVPLAGQVVGAVSALPPRVVLAVPAAGGGGQRVLDRKHVFLRKDTPGALQVTGVTSPNPGITADVVSSRPGPTVRVAVALTAPLPAGEAGELVVRTDDPETPEVSIPIHITVKQQGGADAVPAEEGVTKPAKPAREPVRFAEVLAAVAREFERDQEAIRRKVGKDEASDVAVWLASKLCAHGPKSASIRRELGGISLVRYARARDMVKLRMAKDPELAAKCRRILEELGRAEDIPPGE